LSVILEPKIGDELQINWFNWRPTVGLLVKAGILPTGERQERCLANRCRGYFSKSEAMRAAKFLENLIAEMQPNDRILMDGTTTNVPKDNEFPVSDWDERET